MKKFKINFGFIALFFGVLAALAFKAPEAKQEVAEGIQWFSFEGDDPSDPQDYVELPGPPDCDGASDLCAIQAEENGNTGKPTQAGVDDPQSTREFL